MQRSKDELISDLLVWTPSHGRAKGGRPARTYIQQVSADTGFSPEDLPETMEDIYIYIYIYIYIMVRVFANGPGDLGSIPYRVIPKT